MHHADAVAVGIGELEGEHELGFASLHDLSLFLRNMIIPVGMQNRMDEQVCEMRAELLVLLRCPRSTTGTQIATSAVTSGSVV